MHSYLLQVLARPFVLLLILLSFSSSARAADLSALQGKWKAEKDLNGQKVTFHLAIQDSKFHFQLKNREGEIRMTAKGTVKVEKLGPFQGLFLSNIEAGGSDNELQAVDETRSYIYVISSDTLTVAANFDGERDNQEPNITVYRKQ